MGKLHLVGVDANLHRSTPRPAPSKTAGGRAPLGHLRHRQPVKSGYGASEAASAEGSTSR